MITKLTRELEPGDVILRNRIYRTVRVVTCPAGGDGNWDITLEPPGWPGTIWQRPGDEEWKVREPQAAPSGLDLAVARAQELADHYDREDEVPIAVRAKDLHDLLDLFRAAR